MFVLCCYWLHYHILLKLRFQVNSTCRCAKQAQLTDIKELIKIPNPLPVSLSNCISSRPTHFCECVGLLRRATCDHSFAPNEYWPQLLWDLFSCWIMQVLNCFSKYWLSYAAMHYSSRSTARRMRSLPHIHLFMRAYGILWDDIPLMTVEKNWHRTCCCIWKQKHYDCSFNF